VICCEQVLATFVTIQIKNYDMFIKQDRVCLFVPAAVRDAPPAHTALLALTAHGKPEKKLNIAHTHFKGGANTHKSKN
jgi:hypothetical protein